MSDDLSIPAYLDLKLLDVRARHDQARRDWKPGVKLKRGDDTPRIATDSKGRSLPASMDDESWAMLRTQEKADAEKTEARFAALKELGEERKRARQEAQAAVGTKPKVRRTVGKK